MHWIVQLSNFNTLSSLSSFITIRFIYLKLQENFSFLLWPCIERNYSLRKHLIWLLATSFPRFWEMLMLTMILLSSCGHHHYSYELFQFAADIKGKKFCRHREKEKRLQLLRSFFCLCDFDAYITKAFSEFAISSF